MNKPCKKVYFESERAAQRRANELNRIIGRDAIRQLFVYHCPFCLGYHLTKKYQEASSDQQLINQLNEEIVLLKQRNKDATKSHNERLKDFRKKDAFLLSFLVRYGLVEEFKELFNAYNFDEE